MIDRAPRIETERLVLRGALATDHARLSLIRAKEEVGKFVGGAKSAQECWFMILQTVGMWPTLGYGYWVIDLKESGNLIGEVGFADFKRGMTPDISGAPEAGWVLDEPYWGKGLMTEAVQAAHDWLDTRTEHTRSSCIISPEHAPSIRVAEKCGYERLTASTYKDDEVVVFQRQGAGS